jgi:two-component system phosphate regulon sensor histidine kinase PhoR
MTIDPNKIRFVLWGAAIAFLIAALLSLVWSTTAIWWGFIVALMLAGAYGITAPKNIGASLAGRDAVDPLDVLFSPLARQGFEQLPDPVMLLDVSSRVLFANAAMRGLVGPEPRGKHVSTMLRMPAVLEAVARANEGETATGEFTVPVPVERHYQIHATQLSPLPRVTLLLLHDLTTVRRSERMRADFVANASHELRTPLAAVSGFVETLKGHAKNDPEARDKFLDIMSVESARMRRLIDDLLSLTRIELNEHVPPSGETLVQHVLREAVAALMPLAEADDITIEVKAAEDLPPVKGQRDEIMQLFQNLTHNAIKYGKPHGHVWIEAEMGVGGQGSVPMLKVSVRDDGEGIPASAIPRLTERFYRVDVKRSREKGGTGLGLAIAKHIVSRHHGQLRIESEAGEGSIFTVFLPIAATAGAVT